MVSNLVPPVRGKHLTATEKSCMISRLSRENSDKGGAAMDALEMTLLFDYYGDLLTPRQRQCLDLRYNQDLSLGEVAQELGISRQGVYDTLNRAEALLRKMEEKTGCVRRDRRMRGASERIFHAASALHARPEPEIVRLAQQILDALRDLEE